MTAQKKILDLTGSQYLVQKVKSAINDVGSSLSTHIADTDIHVTTADKNKWNNQTYVFRYSSTALVASSTNSNTLLDNTDNLKVGDKVIDSSGVLFSITAIDTANSTFTIGTALIDLAQDSDVVHKSGDETVGGRKTFSENITCFSNSDAKSIICKTPLSTYDSTNTVGDNTKIRFLDKNNNSISYIMQRKLTNGSTDISLNVSNTDSNNQPIEATLTFVLDSANEPRLSPGIDNTISIGRPTFRYKSFYGMNYYYGSNNVEFSDKFVTTDTNQTITGTKTFLDVPIPFKSSTAELGVTGGSTNITFSDKNGKNLSGLTLGNYGSSKLSYARLNIFDKDTNNNEIQDTLEYAYISNNNNAYLRVSRDNFCSLGTTSFRWKGVYAQSYYYGSNNVEFSTKFVTTDTNQTISGEKTFSSSLKISNSDTTVTTPDLNLKNYKADRGTTDTAVQAIQFLDKNGKALTTIESRRISNGNTITNILCYNTDDSNNTVSGGIAIIKGKNDTSFAPNTDNAITCGRALAKWSDVVTYKVNGVEPSSLSLPSGNVSDFIDISSYFSNTGSGDRNSYTSPANGWIYLRLGNIGGCQADVFDANNNRMWGQSSTGSVEQLTIPILKGQTLSTQWNTSSTVYVDTAKFIPCQGNV